MSQSIRRLQHRLLVSAAQGYAAQTVLNRMAPLLRAHFAKLAYWQQSSPMPAIKHVAFDSVHPAVTPENAVFLKEYDLHLNIMGPDDAAMAMDQGLKTILYDDILKYGNAIPSVMRRADILLTPEFYSVNNRVRHIKPAAKDILIIPPFSQRAPTPAKRDTFFVSFCGLDNTTSRHGNDLDYVRGVMHILQAILPRDKKVVIAGSQQVATAMAHMRIRHYAREEIENILAHASKALMTPSLQHIFDSVSHQIDTLWLPPARADEGLNLQSLQRRKVLNFNGDWSGITDTRIDYEGDDIYVLGFIHREIKKLLTQPTPQEKLRSLVTDYINATSDVHAIHKMNAAFGINGQNVMLNAILGFARAQLPHASIAPAQYARR